MQPQTDPFSDAGRAKPDVLKSLRLDGLSPGAAFDDVVRRADDPFEVPTAPVSSVVGRERVLEARVDFGRPLAAFRGRA